MSKRVRISERHKRFLDYWQRKLGYSHAGVISVLSLQHHPIGGGYDPSYLIPHWELPEAPYEQKTHQVRLKSCWSINCADNVDRIIEYYYNRPEKAAYELESYYKHCEEGEIP